MKIYAFEMNKSIAGGNVSLIIIRQLINQCEKSIDIFWQKKWISVLHNA